mmetsp:Transcript_14455/g.41570  ORF Transcript_14455/g.41570 Transcript_14455/m.41570 type:complete len:135 (+) Transcript_14455:1680-2084(+)
MLRDTATAALNSRESKLGSCQVDTTSTKPLQDPRRMQNRSSVWVGGVSEPLGTTSSFSDDIEGEQSPKEDMSQDLHGADEDPSGEEVSLWTGMPPVITDADGGVGGGGGGDSIGNSASHSSSFSACFFFLRRSR